MKAIEFEEASIVIAKDQPQYNPLPAACNPTNDAHVLTFCWQLSWRERLKVLVTGKLWHRVLTFRHPLQPQLLLVDKPTHEELTGGASTEYPG